MALAITDSNFEQEILQPGKVALVDFWATWCGPCRMIGPVVEEIAEEYKDKATVCKCNVDDNSEIPVKFGIRNIPTLLFFKDGELKDKIVGATTKASIEEKLNKLL